MRVARLLLCYVLLEDYSTNLGGATITSDAARQDASATNPTLSGTYLYIYVYIYIFSFQFFSFFSNLEETRGDFFGIIERLITGRWTIERLLCGDLDRIIFFVSSFDVCADARN